MRSSRLLSILILLQLRGRVTGAELATQFEVSERTIYRDIDALSAAGVPVYGDRGPGGGFALLDGYQTRLTGMAPDEAEAVPVMGIAGIAADLGLGPAASGARDKLFAALSRGGLQRAGRVADRVHVDVVDWYRAADPLPHLPLVARAVFDGRVLTMRYDSWRGARAWTVAPYGLILKGGSWYLAAQSAAKVRIFRLANMTDVAVLDENVLLPARFDLAAWWAEEQARFEAELFACTAILRATPLGLRRLAALSPRGAAAARAAADAGEGAAGGWTLVTMAVENSDHGARELLGLGAEIEVLAPPDFRARVAELAGAITAHYRVN